MSINVSGRSRNLSLGSCEDRTEDGQRDSPLGSGNKMIELKFPKIQSKDLW